MEGWQDELSDIMTVCLARLGEMLRDESLGVRDLVAAGKEARSLQEALGSLQPPPVQEFRLELTVEEG